MDCILTRLHSGAEPLTILKRLPTQVLLKYPLKDVFNKRCELLSDLQFSDPCFSDLPKQAQTSPTSGGGQGLLDGFKPLRASASNLIGHQPPFLVASHTPEANE